MAEPDSIDDFIQVMNKASESTRASIAQQLKDAGFYKGKVTGKFDQKLYVALKSFGVELDGARKFQTQFVSARNSSVYSQRRITCASREFHSGGFCI